jgi:hypothetical protein
MERIQMHPADLAAMLGVSIAEAEERQRFWTVAVLPFLHARLSPEVSVDNRQVINLTIGRIGGSITATPAIKVIDTSDYEPIDMARSVTDPLPEAEQKPKSILESRDWP